MSAQELLLTLAPILGNEDDSAHSFAKEFDFQVRKYFAFLLNSKASDFLAIYWTTTFLAPVYRGIISPDEMSVVRIYLESKSPELMFYAI